MFADRFPEKHRSNKAARILLVIVGVLLLAALFGFLVQFLWNATIATLFDITAISYWQAVGLFILAKLFFGFGSRNSGLGHRRRKRRKFLFNGDVAQSSDRDQQAQFKAYWKEEGEKAFEEYLSAHQEEPKTDPKNEPNE